MTSRRATGWDQAGTVLRLPMLERAEAADLLERTADPATQTASQGEPADEAAQLAEELGGLPLALRQAGAYIAATPGMTVGGYLHRLRTSPGWAMAARPPGGPGRSDARVVAGTWALTIDRIKQIRPLAVRVLRLLAWYAPDRLPCNVLYGLPGTDQIQVGEVLAALAAYSMIEVSPDRRYVSVHRLVQAVTRTGLTETDRAADQTTAAALLQRALPDDPEAIASWPGFAELLPHARLVLAPDSDAMNAVITSLHASGDYRTAREVQHTRATTFEHTRGSEHPDTLTARANLAFWTGDAGDVAGARDLYAELLPVRERVSGPDHPQTLNARANLAHWTEQAGPGS